jgi:hypothetical protein
VCYFECQRARLRDRLEKEPARNPGTQSHLPGFQNNVSLSAQPFKLRLCPVWLERDFRSAPPSDFEERTRQKDRRRATLQQVARPVQNRAKILQLFKLH